MLLRPRALAYSLFICLGLKASAADRPDILFLLSDDQRASTIQALGNPNIRTPTVDRLVARGTAFERAYCMGAKKGAVCVPSRAMPRSGRTLFRVKENLAAQETWPEQFAAGGYRTFMTGKWHNGGEAALRSFQEGKAVFLGGINDPRTLLPNTISASRTENLPFPKTSFPNTPSITAPS